MFRHLIQIWRPAVYHGTRKKANFFEGWFYKLSNAASDRVYAVIPGVFLGKNSHDSHAFIQILDGQDHQSTYHRFPLTEFHASATKFEMHIGKNFFSNHRINLDLEAGPVSTRGQLVFEGITPWPVRWYSPGIMGWYAFVPFMECYHGVLSLDHKIQGSLQFNRKKIDFSGGRGYLEKDWGKSFPEAYIWIQSNHFENPGIGLTVSVAKIPWRGSFFRGFLIGFLYQGRLYRFTTYTGSVLSGVTFHEGMIELEVRDRKYKLTIKAWKKDGGILNAPEEGGMVRRVSESLNSRVQVDFFSIVKGREDLCYSGEGRWAGLEIHGRLDEISDQGKNS